MRQGPPIKRPRRVSNRSSTPKPQRGPQGLPGPRQSGRGQQPRRHPQPIIQKAVPKFDGFGGGNLRRAAAAKKAREAQARRLAAQRRRLAAALPAADFSQAQKRAQAKRQRAESRLPQRPTPTVPLLANPTPAQRRHVEALFRRSLQGQVPTRGKGRPADLSRVAREIRLDPRNAVNVAVGDVYAAPTAARARQARALQAAGLLAEAKPGAAPKQLKSGLGVDVNLSSLARSIKGATSLASASPENALVRAALGDVKTLATGPFVGGYEVGKATWDATGGNFKPAGKLISNTAKGYAEELKHPGKAFREHPLLTALDVAGVGSLIGHTAGIGARAAGRGSLVRPPIAMSSDAGASLVQRTYSKDLGRRAVQVANDQRREPLRDAGGKVVYTTDRGRKVPVLKAHPVERERMLKRRGDFRGSRANSRERMVRDHAPHAVAKEVGKGNRVSRKPRDPINELFTIVNDGAVRSPETFVADLARHRERIAAIPDDAFRHTGADPLADTLEGKAGRDFRVSVIDRALREPLRLEQNATKIFEQARVNAKHLDAGDQELIRLGALDAESAARAKLIYPAIEHLGARHVSVEEHARLERHALRAERSARRAVKQAKTPADKAAASALLKDARDHRLAVSGRDPAKVVAHESARERHAVARTEVADAQRAVEKATKARSRVVGAQASRRGRRQKDALGDELKSRTGERKEGKATPAEKRKLKAADDRIAAANARLKAAKAGEKAARADLKVYPRPEANAALRRSTGEHLSNEDIIRETGVNPDVLAFLSASPSRRGSRAFHSRFAPGQSGRPNLDAQTRTGEAYRRGETPFGREAAREEASYKATVAAKVKELDDFASTEGLKHPAAAKAARGETLTRDEQRVVDQGGLFTGAEAEETAQRLLHDTGESYTPIRAFGGLDKATQEKIRTEFQDPRAMETLTQKLLNDRIKIDPASRARNVVLVPSELVERLAQHAAPAGELQRFLQSLNRPFRMAVLPQFRWLVGNFVEPYIVRLPTRGSGIVNVPGMAVDMKFTKDMLALAKKSDNPAYRAWAEQIEAQHLGGLFIGGRGASVKRSIIVESMPHALLRRYPAIMQMNDMVSTLVSYLVKPLDAYFVANRAVIERPAQMATLGRSMRDDLRAFGVSFHKSVKVTQEALDELMSSGAISTATQERWLRQQHETLGKYDGQSPRLRALTQGVAPFLPWTLNSARFVMATMPLHRTATTSFLTMVSRTVQKEWEQANADAPPGGLKYAVRTKDGGFIDIARYTPYGLSIPISQGQLDEPVGQFFPVLQGAAKALQGSDPFGRDLQVPKGPDNPRGQATGGQKASIAINSLAEALIPYLATARRLQEGGGTAYSNSTALSPKVKPGTSHMGAARRTFDPFRPTYLRGPSGGGGGGGDPLAGLSKRDRARMQRQLDAVDSRVRELDGQGLTHHQQRLLDEALKKAGG
jgi:hypothetical protein